MSICRQTLCVRFIIIFFFSFILFGAWLLLLPRRYELPPYTIRIHRVHISLSFVSHILFRAVAAAVVVNIILYADDMHAREERETDRRPTIGTTNNNNSDDAHHLKCMAMPNNKIIWEMRMNKKSVRLVCSV